MKEGAQVKPNIASSSSRTSSFRKSAGKLTFKPDHFPNVTSVSIASVFTAIKFGLEHPDALPSAQRDQWAEEKRQAS